MITKNVLERLAMNANLLAKGAPISIAEMKATPDLADAVLIWLDNFEDPDAPLPVNAAAAPLHSDALRRATDALVRADSIRNQDRWTGDREAPSLYKATEAQAYAAIASAEQSKRIADALEKIADVLEIGGARDDLSGSRPEGTRIWGTKAG